MLQDRMPRGFVVLVVDDDAETVTLLAQLITDAFGCRVLEATSGEEALRIVDSAQLMLLALALFPRHADGAALLEAPRPAYAIAHSLKAASEQTSPRPRLP
jgi:CheY-like chemotaxis protein